MSAPLRTPRAPCALHGLAVADDGRCVRCRRDAASDEGRALGWPALFVLGCCAAGLVGWQAAKMGPEALSLRPQHHLAVVSFEAATPVEQLRRDLETTRARRILRPEPVAPGHAPKAVEVTVTEAEMQAMRAPPPAPVSYYGTMADAAPAAPTKIIVKLAAPAGDDLPHQTARPPAEPLPSGRRRAIPRRPVLLPPPGGTFPGGGTGELWNPRGPSSGRGDARPARRTARRMVRTTPAPRVSAGRMSRGVSSSRAGGRTGGAARPRATRGRR